MVLEEYTVLVTAVVAFGLYSSLYKDNVVFGILEHVLVGVGAALAFVAGITSYNSSVVQPFLGGDMEMIIPIIIGFAYLTVFSKRTIDAYRFITLLMFATSLGVAIPSCMTSIWDWTIQYAMGAFVDWRGFTAWVGFALCITNFLFSKKLEKPSRWPGYVGRIMLMTYSAAAMPALTIGKINTVGSHILDVFTDPIAWIVPVTIFIVILVDMFGGFDRLKRSTEIKQPIQ
jgi:hypothetical protein